MSDNTLRSALVDVRKACRLLYSYHLRTFDMAKTVDKYLDGFEFDSCVPESPYMGERWAPHPKRRQDLWQALPFITHYFLWVKSAADGHLSMGDRALMMELCADSPGWWSRKEDPDPEEWLAVDESKTTLAFSLYRPIREGPGTIRTVYDVEVDEDCTVVKDGTFVAWGQTFDLSDVPTSDVLKGLLTKFLESAEQELQSA